jgi:transposase-like protein
LFQNSSPNIGPGQGAVYWTKVPISKLTVDQQRIRELERELVIAKMERDILKKATAFFAKESK